MADGQALQGVTLSLDGAISASNTTAADGSYAFTDVPEGTYTVSIDIVPQDVVFDQTEQTVTVSEANPDATANFDGSFTGSP